MPFQFTNAQVSDLVALRNQGQYADAYAYIVNALTDLLTTPDGITMAVPAADVPANVWQWFKGAEQVNRGVGPFSDFIRSYTSEQYQIRTGMPATAGFIQNASDEIAKRVINGIENDASHFLPDLATIGRVDAAESTRSFPNGDAAAWSGNLLFVALGNRSFFDSFLLHTDQRDPTDPYDFLAAIHSANHAGGVTAGGFTLAGFAQFISTGLGLAIGPGATLDLSLMAGVSASAVSYFTGMYGQSPYYLDYNGTVLDVQGQTSSITGTSGGELIYGADGSDIINLTAGSDIIDGGSGYDTAQYTGDASLSVLIETRTSVASYLGSVSGSGVNSDLYRVEKLITGSGNDTFMINSFTAGISSLNIDGGSGSNTLSFHNISSDITYDNTFGQITIGGVTVAISNFDRFIGGIGNDIFKINEAVRNVDGGGGRNTL